MKVKEIMTQSPTFCTPETVLEDAARMMCDADIEDCLEVLISGV